MKKNYIRPDVMTLGMESSVILASSDAGVIKETSNGLQVSGSASNSGSDAPREASAKSAGVSFNFFD